MSGVHIKNDLEIEKMRASCRLAARTLEMIGPHVRPGVTTEQIDRLVHDFIVAHDAYPSPLNYHGFPKSVCTSVNETVCHGIPGAQALAEGDIVNVDVTVKKDGFHGDTSATFFVGTRVAEQARRLVEIARRCLVLGIAQVRAGARLGDVGAAVQEYAESQGCSVVRDFVGHGIGREFHEPPKVEHVGRRGKGLRLKPGMIFTIEPMINLGDWRVEVLQDGWTVRTVDRSLSAQFEHTMLVTESGHEILTERAVPLANSEEAVPRVAAAAVAATA